VARGISVPARYAGPFSDIGGKDSIFIPVYPDGGFYIELETREAGAAAFVTVLIG
jgi:hypothetical protein